MAKSSLVRVMALGAVISLTSTAGIFAVFTDRATTGINHAASGEQPHLALQLAAGTRNGTGPIVCGDYVDDLTSPIFSLTDVQPGDSIRSYACLKNTFPGSLSISATAIDLVDTEETCSGDEAIYDTTCDPLARGGLSLGEVSGVLDVMMAPFDCPTFQGPAFVQRLSNLATGSSIDLGSIAGASVACVLIELRYSGTSTWLERQVAQTDHVTWRFAFDATE